MGHYTDRINSFLQNPYLYRYNDSLYRYYLAGQIIDEFFAHIHTDKQLFVWGGGVHTCHMFKLLSAESKSKIAFIIDKEMQEDIFGLNKEYKVPDSVNINEFEAVIVSGFQRKEEIKQDIRDKSKYIHIFDLYDAMFAQGINIDKAFYADVHYSYLEISVTLQSLSKCQAIDEKKRIIKKLIGEYLHIRDFVNAFHYIDILMEYEDEDKMFYTELKFNISNGIESVKQRIDNSQHIILNWIDALRPEEVCNMPFLESLKGKGQYFDNAHTVAPYTSATLKTIFTGKKYLDDFLYKMESLDGLEDTRLYQLIVQNNYEFKYFGAKGTEGILFNEDTVGYYSFATIRYQIASTVWQWEAIRQLEQSTKPLFVIIHNLTETHCPNMNGIQKNCLILDEKDIYRVFGKKEQEDKKNICEQLKISQRYLDRQLAFYYGIYENVRYHIYMSDHGQYRGEFPICIEGHTHIFFLLLGKTLDTHLEEKMFSLLSFPEVVEKLFKNEVHDIQLLCSDYVETQSDDCYSAKIFGRYQVNPGAYKDFYIQHRGVITATDAYLKMITGEEYYLRKDSSENLIGEEKYKQRIEELRKKAGNRFINIYVEGKYAYTRELYQILHVEVSKDVDFLEE